MMEGFKLGLDSETQRVVHIDDVGEGFSRAICPDCQNPLVASNRNSLGRKKDTYFRHKHEASCGGETLVHLWAKQVIAEYGRVLGAEYRALGEARDSARQAHVVERRQAPETLGLAAIELEAQVVHRDQFKTPDIMARVVDRNEPLAIEVFVSNAADATKSEFFVDKSLDCLEIDLSHLPAEVMGTSRSFEQYVLTKAPRRWVHCSRYRDLDTGSQEEAEHLADQASADIATGRAARREEKRRWREEHAEFIGLVEAYLCPGNQESVRARYELHLGQEGTRSHHYRTCFERDWGGIPEIINIPVKGELGFRCHRTVWQWEIYWRVVLYSHLKSTQGVKSVKTTWVTRGYEEEERRLAWLDSAPKWSPESLYQSIKERVPQNRISLEAERIAGKPLMTEGNQPGSLIGLKVKEWRALPKPVCIIRAYIKKLVEKGVLEHFQGDTYIVPQGARLPLVHDVSRWHV